MSEHFFSFHDISGTNLLTILKAVANVSLTCSAKLQLIISGVQIYLR